MYGPPLCQPDNCRFDRAAEDGYRKREQNAGRCVLLSDAQEKQSRDREG